MGKFQKIDTELNGVFLLQPTVFKDDRGFFLEAYNKTDFEELGIGEEFVQDNHSCSAKGVIRGLHFQTRHPQGKLVRVLQGSIYDVVVDIRKHSPTFGKWIGITLSSSSHQMIYVPIGFAHGFLALEDHTEVLYKTTDFYDPEYDTGIRWNDPDIGIAWPLEKYGITSPSLSRKDMSLPLLKEIDTPFKDVMR